jgi:sugar fermentation stimulation protein A
MPGFSSLLIKGRLLRRYKRFFADVELIDSHPGAPMAALDGAPPVVTAHCANTGTMRTCAEPGSLVWLSWNPDPKRKLQFTWELTELPDGGLIGVNTSRPNAIVAEGIMSGKIPALDGYANLRREAPISRQSRCDILLDRDGSGKDICVIEVKNTTLRIDEAVAFPDAVTERGLKHLHELSRLAGTGVRSVMFFLVNRPDGEMFRAAREIDPAYAQALREAAACGVEVMAWRSMNTTTGAEIGGRVDIRLDD